MNPFKMIKAMFTSTPRATPTEAAARVRAKEALLIDVRESGEWPSGVAEHAILLPLSDLSGARARWKPFLSAHDGRELLFYCAGGGRSAIAARILAAEGFHTANAGSLAEWASAGWPIVPPARAPR